jgi:hypothetical protein
VLYRYMSKQVDHGTEKEIHSWVMVGHLINSLWITGWLPKGRENMILFLTSNNRINYKSVKVSSAKKFKVWGEAIQGGRTLYNYDMKPRSYKMKDWQIQLHV